MKINVSKYFAEPLQKEISGLEEDIQGLRRQLSEIRDTLDRRDRNDDKLSARIVHCEMQQDRLMQDLAILSSLRKAHAYKAFFKGREVLYLSVVISKSYVYFLDGMEIRTVNPMAPVMRDIAEVIRAGGTECPQRHLTQIEHLQCDLS